MDIKSDFPNRLRQLRKSKGLTQSGLGELAGISRRSVTEYEMGDYLPSAYVLMLLAVALDVSTDYLVGLSDIPKTTAALLKRAN